MNGDGPRPQLVPEPGNRVVLVVPRSGPEAEGARLMAALDQIAAAGCDLVAVVDPAQGKDALRMVVDGEADLIVTTRPEYFPLVRFAGGFGNERTRPVLRAQATGTNVADDRADARHRRPQPVSADVAAPIPLRDRRTEVIRRTA